MDLRLQYFYIAREDYAGVKFALDQIASEHLVGGKVLTDVFPDGIRCLSLWNPLEGQWVPIKLQNFPVVGLPRKSATRHYEV